MNTLQDLIYLPIWKLSEVIILSIEKLDSVWILFGDLSSFQALLDFGDAVTSPKKVHAKDDDDHQLYEAVIQEWRKIISEENHETVFFVVERII